MIGIARFCGEGIRILRKVEALIEAELDCFIEAKQRIDRIAVELGWPAGFEVVAR